MLGWAAKFTFTFAEVKQPGAVEIVHAYTYWPKAVTAATAEGLVLLPKKLVVPGPDTCDHVPVPTLGVLPPSGALILDWHND